MACPNPTLPAKSSWRLLAVAAVFAALAAGRATSLAADPDAAATFHQSIKPLLSKYCFECHGDGMNKGKVTLDEFTSDADILSRRDLWQNALRNVRAGLMPPPDKDLPRPEPAEVAALAKWIKYGAFATDPANPDPGRVTARRLNRIEYRNTIRDLMGFDYNSEAEFPPDDSGGGFDNNGDILTLSPLLLEKYLSAAEFIADRAVPKTSRIIREQIATGRDFRREDGKGNAEQLTAKEPAKVSYTFKVEHSETYRLLFDLEARGTFDYDPAHCRLICRVDGVERFVEDVVWRDRRPIQYEYDVTWAAGEHTISFEIEPLAPIYRTKEPAPSPTAEAVTAVVAAAATPAAPAAGTPAATPPAAAGRGGAPGPAPAPVTRLDVRVASVTVRGPLKREFWVAPESHARFFPDGAAPEEPATRDRYAARVLRRFATLAFRRPVEEARVEQLVAIARLGYAQPGTTFEQGISRAIMAVLASPRFIFRVEAPERRESSQPFALVDEYALATRLSYFLWSTMPDAELFRLAERGELRAQLADQIKRMLRDPRAQALAKNFTGQWLQARDVEFVPINARAILGPNAQRNAQGRIELDGPTRKAMRAETEMYFEHLVREDRSVLELVDSDYTFLNAALARVYGVEGVTGDELRRVQLPPESVRGGVLTQGTVLVVTSNPTRTSPVKRGLFVLENILGTPPPPPPADVPALEEAKKEFAGREPKLSEMLEVHRSERLCNSCHSRMDPLGLAFENFNPLGRWRDQDAEQPIDPSGQFITGETFANVRELKRVIVNQRRMDYYRCLTEKLLTYALGRGLDYYDVHTVDEIVGRLAREDGRMSALLMGVIESAAFQKTRTEHAPNPTLSPNPAAVPVAKLEAKP